MKTVLICHEDALLDNEGMRRWLASFSNLAGVVVLRETRRRTFQRVKREITRSGRLRFIDVLAFRFYYKSALARRDGQWEEARLDELRQRYPEPSGVEVLITSSPNSAEAEEFIRRLAPDFVIARCKTLLKESVFTIPAKGTFVIHPGICPEYRNAHGCFWALAEGDLKNVGATLLRIDKGVDTGPVYGYFGYDFDEVNESHIVISHRVVFDNLDEIADRLIAIHQGAASVIDTSLRRSAVWGQPWLSSFLSWKREARRRNAAGAKSGNRAVGVRTGD
ncbi:MAG TPA: formyltransferase family protein [Blastocatellia bacterium]|jgi:hypothetical protein|nr:formyltransferase family protein [Blastocatellia bacterium]